MGKILILLFWILVLPLNHGCSGLGAGGESFIEPEGLLDTDFQQNIGSAFNGSVDTIALQSTGKIIVGGRFTVFNGQNKSYLIRLNTDGSLDSSFLSGLGPNDSVFSLAVDSQDNIFVGGVFTEFNDIAVGSFVKLKSSGEVDTDFMGTFGTGFLQSGSVARVNSIKLLKSGGFLVGGEFSSVSGMGYTSFAKFLSSGFFDSLFMAQIGSGPNFGVNVLAESTDEKSVFVGGSFTNFGGQTRSRFQVLEKAGDENSDWATLISSGFNNGVHAILSDSAGGVWVGGAFNRSGSQDLSPLVRINSNLEFDSDIDGWDSQSSWGSGIIYRLALQPNSKVLVGGSFSYPAGLVNLKTQGLARISEVGGVVDEEFSSNLGKGFEGGEVRAISLGPKGELYVGGEFDSVSGTSVGGFAKIK